MSTTKKVTQKKLENSKIRSLKRLLQHKGDTLPAEVRKAKEKELQELVTQRKETAAKNLKKKEKEKINHSRYKMVKFFEKQKIIRSIQRIEKEFEHLKQKEKEDEVDDLVQDKLKKLEQELLSLKADLLYIKHYPLTKKYISVFSDAPKAVAARQRIKKRIMATCAAQRDPVPEKGETVQREPTPQMSNHESDESENESEDVEVGAPQSKYVDDGEEVLEADNFFLPKAKKRT